jgi:subtilisin-like proprotein convertase family protein
MLNRLTRAILALSTITICSVSLFAQKVEDPNPTQIKPSTPYLDTLNRGDSICNSSVTSIPDNSPGGTTSVINVGDSGAIEDVTVDLSVTHSWVGDLIVSVEHGGTTVVLLDQVGVPASTFGCSGDNVSANFSDAAGGPAENVCPATDPVLNGSFTAVTALSAFDGNEASGNWTLFISDNAGGDTGTLDEWCVNLSIMGAMCTLDGISANYTDPDNGMITVLGDCPDGADIYCRPVGGGDILVASGVVINGSATVNVGTVDPGNQYFAAVGGTTTPVVITGPANFVPTLGEWGMIAFVILLVGAGLIYMRRNKQQMA